MLILLLRVAFVTMAVVIGMANGSHYYLNLFDMPPWFGGAMGFSIAITLIAAEYAFRRHFTRSLVAFLVGLGAGLLLSLLMLSVLHLVIQNENIYNNLDLPIALVTTYLVIITVLQHADRFRMVVPFVEFRAERLQGGTVVLDATMLGDGRLAALVTAGLLPRRLLVHRRVLMQCEAMTMSDDPAQQARGHRALEGLAALRLHANTQIEIDETEIPNATSLTDILIHLTRLENARLLTADREVLQRATAEDVSVIDLNHLAAALSPTVRPGESISVRVDKPGEGKTQGIGYLDDGSMVIIANAADLIGQRVRCTVLRLHNTSNGRMVFAERDQDGSGPRPSQKPPPA
jgi:uncharacterized protein YacL